jgi:hypothetical protein
MTVKLVTTIVVLGCAMLATNQASGQHRWKSEPRASTRAEPIRPATAGPRASIGGGSNGIYCPDLSDDAIGVHDLGWIPAGMNVAVTVESYSDNAFDPVAEVMVAALGEKAGNMVKTTTFYDNDSGGDKDARVSLTTAQAGTYLLLVSDYAGKNPGCYRYQTEIGR